jgi:hypothetical protein
MNPPDLIKIPDDINLSYSGPDLAELRSKY